MKKLKMTINKSFIYSLFVSFGVLSASCTIESDVAPEETLVGEIKTSSVENEKICLDVPSFLKLTEEKVFIQGFTEKCFETEADLDLAKLAIKEDSLAVLAGEISLLDPENAKTIEGYHLKDYNQLLELAQQVGVTKHFILSNVEWDLNGRVIGLRLGDRYSSDRYSEFDDIDIYPTPQGLEKFEKLTYLNFYDGQFNLEDLKPIPQLKHLVFSPDEDDKHHLPKDWSGFTGLESLELEDIKFDETTSRFASIPNLKYLKIEEGELIEGLFNLESSVMEEITLYDFEVSEEILKEIFSNTSLKKLKLEDCDLEVIPVEIGQLQNLESINLEDNNIKELPAEFFTIKTLKSILIEDNNLQTLDTRFGQFEQLTFLNLNDNSRMTGDLTATFGDRRTEIEIFYESTNIVVDGSK